MKGICFLTNEQNEKVAVQIDLKLLEEHKESLEDFLDGIIAESRKTETKTDLSLVIKKLKTAGKIA